MKQLPLFIFILFFTIGVGLTIRLYSKGKILSLNNTQIQKKQNNQANLANFLNTTTSDSPATNGSN